MDEAIAGLAPFDINLLDELCQARVTLSSVKLAADLWERGALRGIGDPVGIIQWTLAHLNERGLVAYRLSTRGIPVEIRVTRAGYTACGYKIAAREVGRMQRRYDPTQDGGRAHPGDPTDFHELAGETFGGPILREPLEWHANNYPDHPEHQRQLEECRDMPSQIDPGKVEAIAQALGQSGNPNMSRIARDYDVSEGTVRNVAKAMRATEAFPGIRQRVLEAIVNHGPFESYRDLSIADIGADYHEMVHVCYRLRRAGLISFEERRLTGDKTSLVNIRATKRGIDAAYTTDPVMMRISKEEAVTEDIKPTPEQERIARVVPTAIVPREGIIPQRTLIDPETYPLIAGVIAKYRNREQVRKAAEMLEAAGLVDIAAMALEEGGEPSDLEAEIIRYVEGK